MKKYTNKNNMSLPIAVWCLTNNYNHDKRDNVISATTLLKPIRQIYLGRKYKDNIKEIDASDLLASSMGTALHGGVEEAWRNKESTVEILNSLGFVDAESIYDEVILEKRSEMLFDIDGKEYIISGQFDMAFKGMVCDIKSTSVWSYIFGSKDDDYSKQMSIYKLLNQDIITNDRGVVEYIFTDWSSTKALQDRQYPQSRNISVYVDLNSLEDTKKYIVDKLYSLKKLEDLDDDSKVPDCTDEELWKDKDVYKVYSQNKSGGFNMKRATKVFEDKSEAYKFAGTTGKVVEFKGGAKRCKYCNYTNICTQYERLRIAGDISK